MRTILKYIGLIGLGVLLGLMSAAGVLRMGVQATWVHNGPWRTSLTTGSSKANMYTRASVAVAGLFALNKTEAMYFVASNDSEGKTLQSRCTYRIQGISMQARWWSITLYGSDFFLINNPKNRYSFTMRDLQPHLFATKQQPTSVPAGKSSKPVPSKTKSQPVSKSNWSFVISPKPPKKKQPSHYKGWLSTGQSKHSQMYLNLRMYHASPSVVKALKTTQLPTIQRLRCEGKR